jgi:hypothetical protein
MEKNKSTGSSSSLGDIDPELSPEEAQRQSILKQKRILRRYLRLKRNNFAKRYSE